MQAGTGTRVGLGIAAGGAGYAWMSNPQQLQTSLDWAWTYFLRILENGPIGLWAVLLAVLIGWLVMLRVNMLPFRFMSTTASALIAQLAGTAASFSVVWALWREPLGLLVGFAVALSTPFTWALVLILLEVCPGAWARRWAAELRGEGRQLDLFGRRP